MKILMAISSLEMGGAETHLVSLAKSLSQNGDRVTVVSSGGAMVRELTASGILHVTVPLHRRTPDGLILSYFRLRRLLRQGHFDVIHAHSRIPAMLLSRLARKMGIPLVTTVHARFSTDFPRRALTCWGDRCIAVSEDLRQYLAEEYDISPLRVRVIPNGVDTATFSPSDKPREGREEAFRLLFVSRLDYDCAAGAYALCRIAPKLERAIPGLEILICGGGEALPSVRRMAARVNRRLGRKLIRVPGASRSLPTLYRKADGVVGVSRVALEAAACGAPVVLCGNEGYLGLLTPEDFACAESSNFCCRGEASLSDGRLYDDLVRLSRMPREDRKALGDSLRRLVCERQELSRVSTLTREVYGEAIRERPHRRGEVVLCGYYGFGNLGDDALLRAAIVRARKDYPAWSISALTKGGKRDEPAFGVRCVGRSHPFAMLREIAGARLFVFGGGTLLQDQTSLRSLLFYTFLLRYAARRGVPCELWGNGLGPLTRTVSLRLVKRALFRCDSVGLRDRSSTSLAVGMLGRGAEHRVHLVPDLAEGIRPSEEGRRLFLLRRLFGSRTPPFAIVALRGKEGRGYQRICAQWLAMLRGEGVELVFVNLFPGEDGDTTERLCRALGGRLLSGVSESDLVGLMRSCRVVCGMRLHALVMASAAGTPFVGFGGEEKVRAFCRERGGLYFTDLYHE